MDSGFPRFSEVFPGISDFSGNEEISLSGYWENSFLGFYSISVVGTDSSIRVDIYLPGFVSVGASLDFGFCAGVQLGSGPASVPRSTVLAIITLTIPLTPAVLVPALTRSAASVGLGAGWIAGATSLAPVALVLLAAIVINVITFVD